MSGPVAIACALLLACVFAWAALAKLVRPARWRSALGRYGLGDRIERVAAYGVPAAEATAALLLLWGDARVGAALGLALVAAFSLAVLRARSLSGDRLPCGCFGGASTRDYREMLGRNALLAAASAVVLLAGRRDIALTLPAGGDRIAPTLTAGGLALLLWLVRQAAGSLRRRT